MTQPTTSIIEFEAQYLKNYGRSYSPQKPDFSRCAASVHDRDGFGIYQCRRKNGHGPEGAWCKQHDPEAIKKRRDAETAKWRAEWAARQAAQKQKNNDKRLRPIYEAALRKIAGGSNDPRKDAEDALAMIGDVK
jgi:hypothetical protein